MIKRRELQECNELFELLSHPSVFPFVRQKAKTADEFWFMTSQLMEDEENGKVVSDVLDGYIDSHWISIQYCRDDNFDKHIIYRAIKLLDAIEAAMGKPISGRDSKEVLDGFGEKLIAE